ncbi:MAG: DUF6940 family protein [bacterium]
MFSVTARSELDGRCEHFSLFDGVEPVSRQTFLDLLQNSQPFRQWFTEVLRSSSFAVYRWETPPLTRGALHCPFEFVLVDAPEIDLAADSSPFYQYIKHAEQGVVSFENLGGDALMVVPTILTRDSSYPHLAAFLQTAPSEQVDRLWCMVGDAVHHRLNDQPLWLNAAGGGVAWLHVRLDSRPKYYVYEPYKRLSL